MNKTTAGTVTLSGANTYTGSTTVSAGTLLAANAAALGATAAGTSVASGATLEIANVAIGAEAVTLNGTGVGGNGALTGTGTASLAGNVTLASDGAIGAAPGDSLAVNGAFDGAFALAVLGGGQVTFGAAVGGGTALASLSGAAGTTLAINGGSVRTTGAQSYGGTVTTSGATTLTSTGAGNITANDAANDFSGNLALSTSGTASIVDSNTLALGASSVGTLTARTLSGDLTLNGAISATGAGESIVLVSAQDFVNNAGAGALTVPGAGRWLVYSTDPANDARGGLVYDFKHYGLSYTGPYGGPGTGNGFIYSGVTPTITPSLVGTTSKVYDGDTIATLAAGNYTTTGAIDGDTVTLDNPATGSYDTRNAGTGKTVSSTVAIASASNGAASVYGYTLSSTTASGAIGEITARPITVTAVTDIKTYDGATGSAGVPTITVGSLAPVGGDTAAFTQTFDNRNAGTNKVLTPTGAVTDGNGGNNYLVTFATDSTGVINQRAIMVTAATDTKTYDGTTSSAGVPTITVGSLAPVGGDTAAFTQTFDNRNAGTNKVLTPTGAITDGNGGNNYLVSFATDNTGVITARAVTIASQPGQSKIYGNDDPVGAATAYALTAGSLVGGDGLAGSMGRVAGESLGNYNFTQGTASVSDGNGGNNYAITFDGATNPFQITARALTGTIANQAKVYGQNDPATGGIAVNLAGIVNRAVVDINGNNTLVNDTGLVSASLAGLARNPGESVGSYAITGGALNPLAGAAAGNYSASLSTAGNTLTVTQAPATASIANQNKVYGADDPALGAIGVTLGGLVNANVTDWNGNVTAINDAALTSAVTSLTRVAGENVGSYSMTAGSFTAPSGNYSAPALLGAPTLTIGAAPLAATIADQSKVYGSPDPAIPGIAVALSGLVNNPAIVTWNGGVAVNDTGLVSATLASLTRVAGETVAAPGPTYAITGGTLNPLAGAAAGNYTATLSTAGNTLIIAPAPLSIRADDASRPVNMANPPFTASYSGFQFADTPASLAGALTFSTTATISSPVGAYAVTPAGQSSPNYAITYVPGVLTVGTLTTNIDPLRNVHTLWTAPTAPAGASATTVAAPATGGYIYAAAGEEGSTEEFLALLPPTAAGPDDERAKPASFAGSCLSGSPFSVLRCTLREP
jgi:autotransporter-associated beta strand protein